MIGVRVLRFDYSEKPSAVPAWASHIERWTQLDAASSGLAQATWELRPKLENSRPRAIFLASPQASNETDFQFASTGASSPAKFVHTLPNIRSAALLKLLSWSGPLFCLQNDPATIATALQEAARWAERGERNLWIVTVLEKPGQGGTVFFFLVQDGSEPADFQLRPTPQIRAPGEDSAFEAWLANGVSDSAFSLVGGWEIVKSAPFARTT